MTDEEKEEQLVSWLHNQQLSRHTDKLMDLNGEVGLQSLEDLLELSDEDLRGIGETVNMNMIERKRFLKAVQSMRSPNVQTKLPGDGAAKAAQQLPLASVEDPQQAAEEAEDASELDDAIAKEAGDNDQFEVVVQSVQIRKAPRRDAAIVGTLKAGYILHAYKERVLGGDNQAWAELTALELRRSREPGAQATRGFILIDGSRVGGGLQLRGPLTGDGQVRAPEPVAEETMDAAELQAALEAFSEVPDHAELFEVVWSTVFVTKAPDVAAPRLGALRKGRIIHVNKEPLIGGDGHTWVELTNLELWRSCEPEDLNDRGFVLINGTHLKQGLFLRGPLARDANLWLTSRRAGGAHVDPAAIKALHKTVLPFDKLETYAHLYEVDFSMAFVKSSANPTAKTIGCLKKGQIIQAFRATVQDGQGHAWAELTHHELWHSCKPGSVDDRGFVLIDATHMKEVAGLLLRGPLSPDEERRWKQQQASELGTRASQRQAEQAERTRDAEQFERRTKDGRGDESQVIYTYRALRSKVYIKWSENPRFEWITQSAVRPGTTVHSTGMEWRGPNGERWIDGCTLNGKPRWYLAEDPLTIGGPFLVEKSYTEQHVHLQMSYLTVRGVERFETLIDKNARVRALKERFCKEVNLLSDVVSLKAKFASSATALTLLSDKGSLSEQGVNGDTQLFLEYDNDVYNAMMVGRALGWLAE